MGEMILDTNALSAFAEGDEGLVALLKNANRLCIPSIALGEYRYGIAGSRYRERYEAWLREHLPTMEILSADKETSGYYAEIRRELKLAGTPIPWHDVWIASIVRQHGMAILSRDAHFDQVRGLQRISF
jgi:predicted nucleic acid-binding protein